MVITVSSMAKILAHDNPEAEDGDGSRVAEPGSGSQKDDQYVRLFARLPDRAALVQALHARCICAAGAVLAQWLPVLNRSHGPGRAGNAH